MRYVRTAAVLGIVLMSIVFLGHRQASATEIKPVIRVNPSSLEFNCNVTQRGKTIAVLNASKWMMTIDAETVESWIDVEPSEQTRVMPGNTALFTVSVNCHEVKGARRWTGWVNIEGRGSVSKVKVVAKPRFEPVPGKTKKDREAAEEQGKP